MLYVYRFYGFYINLTIFNEWRKVNPYPFEDFAQTKHAKILWILYPHVNEANLKHSNISNITNQIIDEFRQISTEIFKFVNPDQIIIWSSLARHVDDALYMMEDGFHLPQIVLEQSIYVRFFRFLT